MDIMDLFDFMTDPFGFLLTQFLFDNILEVLGMPVLFGCMIYIGRRKQGAFGGFINLAFWNVVYHVLAKPSALPFLGNPFVYRVASVIYLLLAVLYLYSCYQRGGGVLALVAGTGLVLTRYFILVMDKPIRVLFTDSYHGFSGFVFAILFYAWAGWLIYTIVRFVKGQ